MLIKNMFERPIDRNIEIVIKSNDKNNLKQEFEEYVITDELLNHFDIFFRNFIEEINNPVGNCGVWISGFFGSGKSHFLKILSYILDNKFKFEAKKPIDFFIKDGKIKDKKIISNMVGSVENNDVILFNVASKASNDNIKDVFIKVFNEMQGYSKDPFIASVEKKLEKENKFKEFMEQFKIINGDDWLNQRDDLVHTDAAIESIVNVNLVSKDEAKRWFDSKNEYEQSIEDFVLEVKEYCDDTNHRVIFAVDEIGQFIADNTKMMLDLQTIVEEFSSKCLNKAWVIVTSQQQIFDIIKNDNEHDFSKIQARFKTRISLTSSNVDEVIKWRILEKNSDSKKILESNYEKFESTLKNTIYFKESSDKEVYQNAVDFINFYPFIPYHVDLIQKAIIEIRSLNSTSSSISEGERSLLEIFQKTLCNISNEKINKLIPLYEFYDSFNEIIDSTVAQNMGQAKKNKYLNNFDLNVLKTLFLIKYLDDNYLKPTLDNIVVLMISEINQDILVLRNMISDSLEKLIEQVFVHKNDNLYYYLTKKEQDINLKIKNQQIDLDNVPKEIFKYISNDIYPKKKLKLDKSHSYKFYQVIDNEENDNNLVIRYITSYFDIENDNSQSRLDDEKIINFKHLSEINNEVVVYLNQNQEIYNEIIERLKIEKFLSDKVLDKSKLIECQKREEAIEKSNRTRKLIEDAITESIIYINGNKFNFKKNNPSSILDESMHKLFSNIYNKWHYMDFKPSKKDIKDVLSQNLQSKLLPKDDKSNNALDDLENFISIQTSPISLKEVILTYSDSPYGYVKEDISWLIAKLFSQKRISLLVNENELFLNEDTVQKIYDYITAGKDAVISKKLLLSKRLNIPKKQINFVKNFIKELSEVNESYTDEELMVKFKEIISINNEKIKDYIREIRRFKRYPGLNVLEKYHKLSEDLLNKMNLIDFYSFVFKNKDDFEEYIDELNDIFKFFEGTQRAIFDKSCEICDEFEQNEMLISDSRLKDIIDKINLKISKDKPYSEINNLSDLNKKYSSIFDLILEEERKNLLESINSDYDYVLKLIGDESNLKDTFQDSIDNKFHKLKRDLDSDRNLYSIKGKINTSNKLKTEFVDDINRYKKENMVDSEIRISVNELLDDEFDINDDNDIELFLESIKKEIKKELEKNKTVKIINKK